MVSGTLYSYPGSFRANKICIAAAYSGTNVTVDPDFEFGKTNTSESFLKKFPLGEVPAFEDSNGNCLGETNAIVQYVSNKQLLGGDNDLACAQVRQYMEFAENRILPAACTWTFPTLGFKQYNKQDTEKAISDIKKCLSVLNQDLLTKTFLVGERVTLADISVCCNLVMLYVQVLEPKFRAAYENVNRWFTTCINQPNFHKFLGEIKLCDKMATFDNKRYQELHPKTSKGGDKKEKSVKKEEKKQEKPAKVEEPPKAPTKKTADYFKDVPKSDMVLDDLKKIYKNSKDKEVFRKYLWDNFDSKAYSVWFLNYKYPKEFPLGFMASNLCNGMYQRLESLRKYCLSVLNVYEGSEGGFDIRGAFLFYGTNLPFEMNDDWNVDAPSFDIRKMNVDSEEDKKLFVSLVWSDVESEPLDCKEFL